jgi:hypothetical protein
MSKSEAVADLEVPTTTSGDETSGLVSADSEENQIVRADSNSKAAGSSAEFPPGSLPSNSNISLKQGSSVASSSVAMVLAGSGVSFKSTGNPISFSANPNVDARSAFNFRIPNFNGTSLVEEESTHLVVVFEAYSNERKSFITGIIPTAELVVEGSNIKVSTRYFGTFQAAFVNQKIDKRLEIFKSVKDIEASTQVPVISLTTPVATDIIMPYNHTDFAVQGTCSIDSGDVEITIGDVTSSVKCMGNIFSARLNLSSLGAGTQQLRAIHKNLFGTISQPVEISLNRILQGAPVLGYGSANFSFYQLDSVSIIPDSFSENGSTITSCSASPALPAGLTLNNSTCVITGQPPNTHASTEYRIVATNGVGSTEATFTLTLSQAPVPDQVTGLITYGELTSAVDRRYYDRSANLVFAWNSVDYALSYNIEIYSNSTCTTLYHSAAGIGGGSYSYAVTPGVYAFKITGVGPSGTSAPSACSGSITYEMSPTAVTTGSLTFSADSNIGSSTHDNDNEFYILWNVQSGDEVKFVDYSLAIYSSAGCTGSPVSGSTVTNAPSIFTLAHNALWAQATGSFVDGTTYYAKIQTTSRGGTIGDVCSSTGIAFDGTAPVITIPDVVTDSTTITLSPAVSDALSVTYQWSLINSTTTAPTITSNTSSSTTITGLFGGVHTIGLVVTDAAGNSSSKNIIVTKETITPGDATIESVTKNSINLSWTTANSALGRPLTYSVYRCATYPSAGYYDGMCSELLASDLTTTSYELAGLTLAESAYLAVRVQNNIGIRAWYIHKSATTKDEASLPVTSSNGKSKTLHIGSNLWRFTPDATQIKFTYSSDNGATWNTPSTGATSLALTSRSFDVKANGINFVIAYDDDNGSVNVNHATVSGNVINWSSGWANPYPLFVGDSTKSFRNPAVAITSTGVVVGAIQHSKNPLGTKPVLATRSSTDYLSSSAFGFSSEVFQETFFDVQELYFASYGGAKVLAVVKSISNGVMAWVSSNSGSSWSKAGRGATDWTNFGGGIQGDILASAVDGPYVYIAGNFASMNSIPHTGKIAKLGPSGFEAVGIGLADCEVVEALAVKNGKVYAGCNKSSYGAVRVFSGGTSWSLLGLPFNGAIKALKFKDNDLYAGGLFSSVTGGQTTGVSGLAVIDVSDATPVWGSPGSDVAASAQIYALETHGDDVYVGGTFDDGSGRKNIAKLSHPSGIWTALGAGANGSVYALHVHDQYLYAGGAFSSINSVTASRLARYDFSTWSAVTNNPIDGAVRVIQSLSSFEIAVGGTFSEITGNFSAPYLLTCTVNAGCSSVNAGARQASLNGGVFALSKVVDGLLVGGFYAAGDSTNGEVGNLAIRTSSGSWRGLSNGVDGVINTVVVDGTNNKIFMGGRFSNAFGVYGTTNIVVWDVPTSTWKNVGSGTNDEVNAIVKVDSYMYAGGFFSQVLDSSGTAVSSTANLARLSISALTWGALSAPGGAITSMVYDGTSTIYAAINNGTDSEVKSLSGSTWTSKQTFTGGRIKTMAMAGSGFYVGGNFTSPQAKIAKYNGSSFVSLGDGIVSANADVTSLIYNGSDLYVGGKNLTEVKNTSMTSIAVKGVAIWDGTTWTAPATLPANNINVATMLLEGSNLYVAEEENSKVYKYLSTWSDVSSDRFQGLTKQLFYHTDFGVSAAGSGLSGQKVFSTNGLVNINATSLAVDGSSTKVHILFSDASNFNRPKYMTYSTSSWSVDNLISTVTAGLLSISANSDGSKLAATWDSHGGIYSVLYYDSAWRSVSPIYAGAALRDGYVPECKVYDTSKAVFLWSQDRTSQPSLKTFHSVIPN